MFDDVMLKPISKHQDRKQLNLAHEPQHTYIFDEYKRENLENLLDKVQVQDDLELGMSMEDFVLKHKGVSTVFIPVASFDDEKSKSSNQENVAIIEGVVYPWFGIGYRVDRIQYAFDDDSHHYIDHSREAIMHAQKIANLFIDEARLSGN